MSIKKRSPREFPGENKQANFTLPRHADGGEYVPEKCSTFTYGSIGFPSESLVT